MIFRHLNHLVVIVSVQVHEIIVHRIDHPTLHMNFIMKMGSCRLSGIAYLADNLPAHYLLTDTNIHIVEVGVPVS